jgi:DNA-binding MarR family transcriptional regulator
MSTDERHTLLQQLEHAVRVTSAQGTLFSHAMTERLGINSSDLECLDIVMVRGPVTAGELAQATGLTTGAITGLIDRLEKAGYVRRVRDAKDRRRVIVQPRVDRIERRIVPLYRSLSQAMTALWQRYDGRDLALLIDFAERSGAVMRQEVAKLRETAKPGRAKRGTGTSQP